MLGLVNTVQKSRLLATFNVAKLHDICGNQNS
jgi:hypothetical protein